MGKTQGGGPDDGVVVNEPWGDACSAWWREEEEMEGMEEEGGGRKRHSETSRSVACFNLFRSEEIEH